jgi:hypothetical protein
MAVCIERDAFRKLHVRRQLRQQVVEGYFARFMCDILDIAVEKNMTGKFFETKS